MSSLSNEIECWNCGHKNTVVYGPSGYPLHKCEECGSTIAEGGGHSLAIASNRTEAKSFEDRVGKEEETCGCFPESVIPYQYKIEQDRVSLITLLCKKCGTVITIDAYREMRRKA